MSDESGDEERSIYLRLLLGLLPFDVNITVDVYEDLLSEADETSWPSVARRSANLGLSLGTIGVIGIGIMLYQVANLSNTPLQHIGTGYRLGIAVVGVMLVAKFFLRLMQNIDTGASPITVQEESTLLTALLEFVIGVIFIGLIAIPLYEMWSNDLLLVFFIAITAVGIGVAGICLTFSGAYNFIPELRKMREKVSAVLYAKIFK